MLRHRPSGVAATVLVLVVSLIFAEREGLAPASAHSPLTIETRTPVVPPPPGLPGRSSSPVTRSPEVPVPRDALCPQWWGPAHSAGWEPGTLRALDVVIYRESRCEPDVWNREDPMGGSRGLLQVNGSWTRWLRDRGILVVKEDLFDPDVNLRAALAIYQYGMERYDFGWGPWGFRYVDPYSG